MANLATALRYYVYDKMNTDPAWQNIKVISSHVFVVGESWVPVMAIFDYLACMVCNVKTVSWKTGICNLMIFL